MGSNRLEALQHREYWTISECALVLGRGDSFWRDLFDRERLTGYRAEKGKRFILASSARAYLSCLCAERGVASGAPTASDRVREAFASYRRTGKAAV